MLDRIVSEPDVPRPDNTTLTSDPLVRPLITQLVDDVFLHAPVEGFTATDCTFPSESFAFHFTLTTPATLDVMVGVIVSMPEVIFPLAAIRNSPYPLE
jgi:hypothetical protein